MRRQIDAGLLKRLRDELDKHSIKKEWVTYECKLVTPMYGGGVNGGQVDKEMPIRASAIRGQLRIWWRIACGPFNSPEDMFDRESAIWGGIGDKEAKASRVKIRVGNIKSNGEVAAFEYERNPKDCSKYKSVPKPDPKFGHAYTLFSAQGKLNKDKTMEEEAPHKIAKPELTFELDIHCQTYKDDKLTLEQIKSEVKEAIRWWASFGGIGSRTRRGLGAVDVKNSDIKPVSADEVTLKGGILTLVSQNGKQDPVACWQYGGDKLRDFRQGSHGRHYRKNEKTGKYSIPGRSFWPEADQLRHLTGKNADGKHLPKFKPDFILPRAAFGMPIQFQFPSEKNDPPKLNLTPKYSERMASPLILRPYYDGEKWHAAALLLPEWKNVLQEILKLDVKDPVFKYKNTELLSWPNEQQEAERNRLVNTIEPMKQSNGEARANDPLSAFLDYFKQGQ